MEHREFIAGRGCGSTSNPGRRALVVLALASVLVHARANDAAANAPEDVQGVGARANAMGGAGTALADDFSATYYNPAGLGFCNNSSVAVASRYTAYDLSVTGDAATPEADDPENAIRVTAGGCLKLPRGLALGVLAGFGFPNLIRFQQSTPNDRPRYELYGSPLEATSVAFALAYRPIPELAFGVGASLLIRGQVGVVADLPVGVNDSMGNPETADIELDLTARPQPAIFAGVMAQPTPWLRLGLSVRSANYLDLEAPVTIDANVSGARVVVPAVAESAAFYTPLQVAFGATVDPAPWLTLAFDLTYYNWSRYPGPFLRVTETPAASCGANDPNDPDCATVLALEPHENHGFRDIFVPRVGIEGRFFEDALTLRGGYSFRRSILRLPTNTRANLLDGSVHTVSLGAGTRYAHRPDSDDLLDLDFSLDLYARFSMMRDTSVQKDPNTSGSSAAYRFGGAVYDMGATLTLGWY